ncbi:MAG: hypothetical protein WC423_13935 [Vulcanimicrobiota bacterium]
MKNVWWLILLICVVSVLFNHLNKRTTAEVRLDGLQFGDPKNRVIEALGEPDKVLAMTAKRGEVLLFSFSTDYEPETLSDPPKVWLDKDERLLRFQAKDQRITIDGTRVFNPGDSFTELTGVLGRPDTEREFGLKEYWEKKRENPEMITFAFFDRYQLGVRCRKGVIEYAEILTKEEFESSWH